MIAEYLTIGLALLCALGALVLLMVPHWWEEYRLFGWILLGIAIVLLALAGWGLALPNHEVIE